MADEEIKEQILFVLEDDNEGMRAALDSDLDEQNKEMNRELIHEHERIIEKVGSGETLTADDLVLIRDANEIHFNDSNNLAGRHREAVMLHKWLQAQESHQKPAFDDEGRCLKCRSKVSFADVTDTVVFVGEEIVKRHDGDITNRNCVRCHYPELYPEYAGHDQ